MKHLVLATALLLTGQAYGQFPTFKKAIFKASDGTTLPYRIQLPESGKKLPVILFLHGGGERGTDNEKQLIHGGSLFASEATRKNFPAIVIAPQCPEGEYWGNVKADRTTRPFTYDFNYQQPENQWLKSVMELVRTLVKEYRADEKRIYIIGLSMGGIGTFEAVYRNPGFFAAAVPICGGADYKAYTKKEASIPFRMYHGSDDDVVSVNHSRNMAGRLSELGLSYIYLELPGVKHNSWENAFSDPELLTWMFKQRLN